MKGDFTRDTFHPVKHYSRVMMQQGRVTIDADPNEQTDILLHYLRTLARDLIGPYAGPVDDEGFQLGSDGKNRLTIGAGRYYVDGILVENDRDCLYDAQPYFTLPKDDPLLKDAVDQTGKMFWVYLDVWERHVTWIEDPSIRDAALNGVDTCTRSQVVWQIKSLPSPGTTIEDEGPVGATCRSPLDTLEPVGTGRLAARIDPGQKVEDLCVTPPDARYRGRENHLYRVEIHDDSASGTPTFKWSRENGSVVTPWLSTGGNDLRVTRARGFEAGNWVELSNETLDLQERPGLLVKLAKVEGDVLSVDPSTIPSGQTLALDPAAPHPKIRRWDQKRTDKLPLVGGAVEVKEGTDADPVWIDLENGIQIGFSGGGTYRTGDYWLIPARYAAGIEWSSTPDGAGHDVPDALPPHGVEHHYAPLGFIAWEGPNELKSWPCGCQFFPMSNCANVDRVAPLQLAAPAGARPSRAPKRRRGPR
jgi:hypothetical protein